MLVRDCRHYFSIFSLCHHSANFRSIASSGINPTSLTSSHLPWMACSTLQEFITSVCKRCLEIIKTCHDKYDLNFDDLWIHVNPKFHSRKYQPIVQGKLKSGWCPVCAVWDTPHHQCGTRNLPWRDRCHTDLVWKQTCKESTIVALCDAGFEFIQCE